MLDMVALTAWVNDPARAVSVNGGTATPFGQGVRAELLVVVPGLWGATSAIYRNDHATFARIVAALVELESDVVPPVITQGKQFDVLAIGVKNSLGEYMRGHKRQRAA